MGRDKADFELVPHISSHVTSAGTNVTTKSLKVSGNYDSRQIICRSLFECLKKGWDDPNLTAMSSTGEWKLIPFAQNTLSRDQMTELIKRQSRYLHKVHAISFINIGFLEGSFLQNEENRRGGSKRKSVAAIEETAEVSTKKSTGDERDNSNSTGENDANNIQEEDTTMEDR